jgi:hypothetical protein
MREGRYWLLTFAQAGSDQLEREPTVTLERGHSDDQDGKTPLSRI